MDKNGVCALMFACSVGALECVKFLLSKGADVDQEDTKGKVPVHYATGQAEILRLLVTKKANLDVLDERDDHVLHLNARAGHADCLEEIIEALTRYVCVSCVTN